MMPKIEDYTIGWICAITAEYVAAQEFLDDPPHGGVTNLPLNRKNEYTLGSISGHNVVISVLPKGQYGTSTATRVVEEMLHSFPNIRIGLMVGIGGGAPSQKHDIRLGDVVVSTPGGGHGGVFQYDFGKMIQDRSFHPTGFLNKPPDVVCAAVAGLEAQYERKGHQLDKHIDNILKRDPSKLLKKYQRPDPASDRLYRNHIIHRDGNNSPCALICGDDPSYLVSRTVRTEDDPNPAIHYGLIGSGNTLIRDALVRDKFATQKEILCFEMEAAGLMNVIPCIVIRGICDYADTHKNDTWQGYAAMVAAAYARDLLYKLAPQEIVQEPAVNNFVEQERRNPPTKIENHNWYFDIPLDGDLINRMRTSQKRKRTEEYSDSSSSGSDDDRKKARQNHHEKSQPSSEESQSSDEESDYGGSFLDDYTFENETTRSPTGPRPTLDLFPNEDSSRENQLDESLREISQEPEALLAYPFDSAGSDETSVSSTDSSQY
jgi:nucleoside phosphorylase